MFNNAMFKWFWTIFSLGTPDNSAIIDTVYLAGIVTSSSSPNISLSILIHTLR